MSIDTKVSNLRDGRIHPLARWSVVAMFVAAALHSSVAIAQTEWLDVVSGGVWNTVSSGDDAAMATLWFTLAGIGLLGLAILTRRLVLETGRMPWEAAGLMFAIGIPTSILEPASGGWLLLAVGVLAAVASRHGPSNVDARPPGTPPGTRELGDTEDR